MAACKRSRGLGNGVRKRCGTLQRGLNRNDPMDLGNQGVPCIYFNNTSVTEGRRRTGRDMPKSYKVGLRSIKYFPFPRYRWSQQQSLLLWVFAKHHLLIKDQTQPLVLNTAILGSGYHVPPGYVCILLCVARPLLSSFIRQALWPLIHHTFLIYINVTWRFIMVSFSLLQCQASWGQGL